MQYLIGFDMDGVMSGWDEHLSDRASEHRELDDFPRQPERGWNDFKSLDPRHKKLVMDILLDPTFYTNMKPIEGAIDAIKEVVADGHDFSIVTTPWDSNPMGHQGKVLWIQKHLGWEYVKRLTITRDKTRWVGDVLVDDKPKITGKVVPSWRQIFFTQPYNDGLPGPRIHSWTGTTWKSVLYGEAEQVQGVRAFDTAS